VRHLRDPSRRDTVLLAVTVVALFLTRSSYVILAPLVISCSMVRYRGQTLRVSLVVAFLIAAPICGWMIRNGIAREAGSRLFGVGPGMALWVRAVELEESTIAARERRIEGKAALRLAHGASDPAVQLGAERGLHAEAVAIIRTRLPEFVAMTV